MWRGGGGGWCFVGCCEVGANDGWVMSRGGGGKRERKRKE